MTETNFQTAALIRLQRFSWYFALAYFGLVAFMVAVGFEGAVEFARYGVIYVLLVTVAKLFIMAHQFRKVRMNRLVILCYALVLILGSTILLRYFA